MTTPDAQPPAEERPEPARPSTGPTVTTAPPPRAGRRWSRVPTHVGPARTSTIVLAVLFVGIFVLWLYVKPPTAATAGTTGGSTAGTGQVEQPTPTRTPTPPPTRTSAPTTPRSSSTGPSQTSTSGRAATSTPSATTGAPTGTSGGSTTIPPLQTSGPAPTS